MIRAPEVNSDPMSLSADFFPQSICLFFEARLNAKLAQGGLTPSSELAQISMKRRIAFNPNVLHAFEEIHHSKHIILI
jgi:hypothetical protein